MILWPENNIFLKYIYTFSEELLPSGLLYWTITYRQVSNIRRTLLGNLIVDHSDVVNFLGLELLRTIHFSSQGISNMASDWLMVVLPAEQKPDLKILLSNMDFNIKFSW